MVYNIKRIDGDTIEHQIAGLRMREVGIAGIENLQAHCQDWVTQRKQIFKITKVTNDLGLRLK